MIGSFKDVVDLWPSPDELATDIDVKVDRVRKWRQRGIPASYWEAIVKIAATRGYEGVDYETLAHLAAKRAA